jgi:hypothetical protein
MREALNGSQKQLLSLLWDRSSEHWALPEDKQWRFWLPTEPTFEHFV